MSHQTNELAEEVENRMSKWWTEFCLDNSHYDPLRLYQGFLDVLAQELTAQRLALSSEIEKLPRFMAGYSGVEEDDDGEFVDRESVLKIITGDK